MMSFLLRTLPIVHEWVRNVIAPGDCAVDATVGNGHDTVFLADLVGEVGHVIGFDIQEEAVSRTATKLEAAGLLDRVTLHIGCHSEVGSHLSGQIGAAMFNLGYLPNADKSIITQTETTIAALEQCLEHLKPQGIITIMCYPGHEGGASEALAVDTWARALETPNYLVMRMAPHNPRNPAPYLLAIQKNFG